jgi:hypothetical protein
MHSEMARIVTAMLRMRIVTGGFVSTHLKEGKRQRRHTEIVFALAIHTQQVKKADEMGGAVYIETVASKPGTAVTENARTRR